MSQEQTPAPQGPDDVAAYLDALTFSDAPVPVDQVPPRLRAGEDVLVPRSFKIPQRLDAALAELAAVRGISKSDLVRRCLETAVAADLAAQHGGEVLIPLSEALRALSSLPQLPRTA